MLDIHSRHGPHRVLCAGERGSGSALIGIRERGILGVFQCVVRLRSPCRAVERGARPRALQARRRGGVPSRGRRLGVRARRSYSTVSEACSWLYEARRRLE